VAYAQQKESIQLES